MNARMLYSALLLLLVGTTAVSADVVVDTGLGNRIGATYGRVVSNYYWQAGKFTTNQTYTIDSVQGWLMPNALGEYSTSLTLAIYRGGESVPSASSQVFARRFSIPSKYSSPYKDEATFGDGWFGISGANLQLTPGIYWAAFEVRPGDTYHGSMSTPVPNPLSAYARQDRLNNTGWVPPAWYDDYSLGLKVLGTPVPEPSSIIALLCGISGIGGMIWRRKSI